MPKGNAIKSPAQFRMMEAAAHGAMMDEGPSAGVAKKLLAETSHEKKSKFAKAPKPPMLKGKKKPGKRASELAMMQMK